MKSFLTIEFTNGNTEMISCDGYGENGASLMYYVRFGVKAGTYHIPYSQIRRWKVE